MKGFVVVVKHHLTVPFLLRPLKIFSIGQSTLAAAAWSKHFCCICFVVFILACCSRLASDVFGAVVNTKLIYAFLHSLHWLGSLVWQIYPTNICLALPESEWQPANVLLCLQNTLRFTVAGWNPKLESELGAGIGIWLPLPVSSRKLLNCLWV